MRGAFGKPQGTVARVHIGQPIMSVRSADRYNAQTIEALRRAKFKFPGRQKVSSFCLNISFYVVILVSLDLRLKEVGIYKIRSCTLRRIT